MWGGVCFLRDKIVCFGGEDRSEVCVCGDKTHSGHDLFHLFIGIVGSVFL